MQRYTVLFVVFGSILWGTDSLFRRPLSRELSPITIVFLEHCILSAVMLPVILGSLPKIREIRRGDWLSLVFIAAGGSVAATSLFTYSIKVGNPSVTVLLQKTQPLFALFLARWFLRESPGRWFWHCLLPAAIGAYLVSTPDWSLGFARESYHAPSVLSALGAASLWGSSTVLGRYIVVRIPISVLTSLRFVISLPVLAALYSFQPLTSRTLPSASTAVGALIAMALLPGLLALILYYKGLQTTIASRAAVAELAFPITAVITNWLVLKVHLASSQILGGSLLVGAVTVLTYLDAREKRIQHPHSSPLEDREAPANAGSL